MVEEDGTLIHADAIAAFIGQQPANTRRRGKGCPALAAWRRARSTLAELDDFGALEFSLAAGVSRRSAQRYLARLWGIKKVVRLGAGRATRYRAANVSK